MSVKCTIFSVLKDTRAVAALEFALIAPILILMLLGGYQMSEYFLLHQKVERVAYTVADVTTQSQSVTSAQLDLILDSAAKIMEPYPFGANGVVIISSVYKETDVSVPVVRWQYVGGGTLPRVSRIGAVLQTAELPGDMELNTKENVIISEVFYTHDDLFTELTLDDEDMYKYAIYKPRLGDLNTAPGV